MVGALKHQVEATVTRAAHTAALGAVATITLLVGLGFLTLAAWLVLSAIVTPLQTALIIGSAYLGLSLLCIVVIMVRGRSPQPQKPERPTVDTALADVLTAFAGGLNAGRQARSSPR